MIIRDAHVRFKIHDFIITISVSSKLFLNIFILVFLNDFKGFEGVFLNYLPKKRKVSVSYVLLASKWYLHNIKLEIL